MKKHQEEMLFRTAANSYVEKEGEEIQKEMENVDEVFVKMAAENHKEFEKILDREFGTKKKSNRPVMYKVAMVLLVVILGFGVSVATVPALRSAVVDFVNYVTGNYSEVGDSPDENRPTKEFEVDGIEKEYVVTYLPKGFVLMEKSVEVHRCFYNYVSKDNSEQWISFSQIGKEISVNVDTEKSNRELIHLGKQDAFINEEENSITIIIEKDKYQLVLEGLNVTRAEMIKIAKSIK